jgi:hypothetical protein
MAGSYMRRSTGRLVKYKHNLDLQEDVKFVLNG